MSAVIPNPNDNDGYLNTEDAAAFIGLKPGTLQSWRTRDRRGPRKLDGPPYVMLGNKLVVYKKSDLIAWVESHRYRVAPAQPGAQPFPWQQT